MKHRDEGMFTNYKFNHAAFKHGVTEDDIRFAFLCTVFDRLMEEEDNKYLHIGFDGRGNLLEVMYNSIDEQSVNIFHAMKCRKSFIALINH
jgi:hypothetical protein